MLDSDDVRASVAASLRAAGLLLEEDKYPPIDLRGVVLTPEIAREAVRIYDMLFINPMTLVHACALRAHEYLLPLVWARHQKDPTGSEVDEKLRLARTLLYLERQVRSELNSLEATYVPLTPAASGILHAYAAALGHSVHVVTNLLLEMAIPDIYEDPWSVHPVELRLRQLEKVQESSPLIRRLLQEPRSAFVLVPEVALRGLKAVAYKMGCTASTAAWRVLAYRAPMLVETLKQTDNPAVAFAYIQREARDYWATQVAPAMEAEGLDPQKRHRVRIGYSLSEVIDVVAVMVVQTRLEVATAAIYQECQAIIGLQDELHGPRPGSTKQMIADFLQAQERALELAWHARMTPKVPEGAPQKVVLRKPQDPSEQEETQWNY